ncbi:GAF domain-containing protein [Rhodococcus sp. NPDC057297]|uniref:GAF domain-containing protein n=1 Tax=Rhodococcus sp. NPDC057297 TaxID=3346090 RepID=UPI003628BFF6
MQTDWLLISIYGGFSTRSVVAIGDRPRPFLRLEQHFSSKRQGVNTRAVHQIDDSIRALEETTSLDVFEQHENGRRTHAIPVRHDDGTLHAVYVWRGPEDVQPGPRNPAGAWEFNLTAGSAHGSSELFDLYGVSPEARRSGVAQAGAFERLKTNADEGAALAKIVTAAPGTQHQAVWTVVRDDGEERAAHFSCRMVENDSSEVLLRGVTQDIGAATTVEAAPPPRILEHRVLEAIKRPGEYHAILDLKRLRLIRWHGEAMPEVAWESLPGQPVPAIHPDDMDVATAMSSQLATVSPVQGVLRFRHLTGEWRPIHIEISLMALDQSTTAGFAVLRPLI